MDTFLQCHKILAPIVDLAYKISRCTYMEKMMWSYAQIDSALQWIERILLKIYIHQDPIALVA